MLAQPIRFRILAALAAVTSLVGCGRTDPEPAAPAPVSHPELPGFTFLRQDSWAGGHSGHTLPVYRCDALARAIGLPAGETAIDCEFVLLPGGSFQMGSPPDAGRPPAEGPPRQVTIAPFLLARTELTQRVWAGLMGSSLAALRDAQDPTWPLRGEGPLHPVYYVTWDQAADCCAVAGLRLPSEAEWEYACRAGTTTAFWFGEDPTDLQEYGWYCLNSGHEVLPADTPRDRVQLLTTWGCQTRPVGGKPASPFGLFDMHGNVWEWCADTWHEDYLGAPPDQAPWVDPGATARIVRGGGWNGEATWCRSASRGRRAAGFPGHHVGLRPACSADR